MELDLQAYNLVVALARGFISLGLVYLVWILARNLMPKVLGLNETQVQNLKKYGNRVVGTLVVIMAIVIFVMGITNKGPRLDVQQPRYMESPYEQGEVKSREPENRNVPIEDFGDRMGNEN